MGWFNRSMTCEEAGAKIAEQCIRAVMNTPRNDGALFRELVLLAVAAHRLGIRLADLPNDKEARVLAAYDSGLERILDRRGGIGDLVDHRREQYRRMLEENVDSFKKGDRKPFDDELSFRFGQFCLGGGEVGEPVIISDDPVRILMLEANARSMFADSIWSACRLIEKHDLT